MRFSKYIYINLRLTVLLFEISLMKVFSFQSVSIENTIKVRLKVIVGSVYNISNILIMKIFKY